MYSKLCSQNIKNFTNLTLNDRFYLLTSQRLTDDYSYHDNKMPSWRKLWSLKINSVNSFTTCR